VRILTAIAAALLLAVASSVASAGGSSQLTGKTWQLARLAGIDRQSLGITATFTTAGKLSGFSGCNQYSGTYTASGSSIRVSDKLASTQMACRASLMLQERAYLKALTSARTYSVKSGTLTLSSSRGIRLATFGVQSQSLAGTKWDVVAYNNGKQAVVSVDASTKLTAAFTKDHVSGFAGCNDYDATVTTAPPKITVGPVASTRKACSQPAGVMEQESAYLAALQSAATYSLQGSTLELRTAGDAIAVTLQRA
jgi:heat shock protein HslJ